jgi:Ca-activated chloride channel homolog
MGCIDEHAVVEAAMKLGRPEMLYLIWAVLALIPLYVYAWRRKRSILEHFAVRRALEKINPEASHIRPKIKAALILAALAALSVALSGVKYGYHWQTIEQHGVSLVMALDCSKSMLAQDIQPNRLERAKREIYDLLGMLRGDKVGLVAFSGTAFLQCPLTLDYGAFHLFLNALTPDFLPVGGTDLAQALKTSLNAFDPKDGSDKAVILITDGESTTAGVAEVVRQAAEMNIKIFTIGVGSPEGAPVPDGEGGFKKDTAGNIVHSRLDEALLQQMADETQGRYVLSEASDMDLETIYFGDIRSGMEATEIGGSRKQVFTDRYQWFLGAAILALMIDLFMSNRKRVMLVILALIMGVAGAGTTEAASKRTLIEQGLKAYQSEDYPNALKAFQSAHVLDPDDPAVSYNLGNSQYKLENYQEALASFQAALASDDPALKGAAEYNLGNTAFRLGQYPEAIKHYENTLTLNPNDEDARKNIEYVKKLMEEHKQSSNDSRDDSSEKDEDNRQGDNQNEKPRDASEDSEHAEDRDNNRSGQPSEEKEQSPGESPSEEKTEEEQGTQPQYADNADPDELPPPPEPDESRTIPDEATGETAEEPPSGAAVEQMLNRLKDRPGAALMPQYEKRHVEKDW